MMFHVKHWRLIAAVIVLITIACFGNSDYENELLLENQYSQNVCAGYWPDYKDLRPNCRNGK